jgi:hypothetical protein
VLRSAPEIFGGVDETSVFVSVVDVVFLDVEHKVMRAAEGPNRDA